MSADPQIRDMEKRISQEERTDQKNLDHVIKDLKNAEKAHQKAIKVRVPPLNILASEIRADNHVLGCR